MSPHLDRYIFSIDKSVVTPDRELRIFGWCISPTLEPVTELWVSIEGQIAPCLAGLARPDIAEHFHRPALRASGFIARVLIAMPNPVISFLASPDPSSPPIYTFQYEGTDFEPAPSAQPAAATTPISILLPADDTHPYYRYRSLASLRLQTQPDWQLCDTAGAATGPYTLLLSPGDEFHPEALREISRTLDADPSAALLYSDEDRIDDAGTLTNVITKPDFDPDLILASNYIGRIICLRTEILQAAQAQDDWDLLLHVLDRLPSERVRHIPLPLYSRRFEPAPASQRVLEDCVSRRGIQGSVEPGLEPGTFRIRRKARPQPFAVVLRYNDGAQQRRALARTRQPEGVRYYELSWSGLSALDSSDGPLLSLSDLDAEILLFIGSALDSVNHHFLEEILSQCQRPECGMVIAAEYFAVKRDILQQSGGLSHLSPDTLAETRQTLVAQCRSQSLQIVSTPYAVATPYTQKG
jgi:hypothetical protein